MRVRTRATATCAAGTHAVTPFGRFGTCTRYDEGRQRPSTRTPRIEKIVGTPFTFRRPKRAKARPPGRRETTACERTTAAYASFAEPSRWNAVRDAGALRLRLRSGHGPLRAAAAAARGDHQKEQTGE